MKKKILAGVLALMMAAGAVAMPSDVVEDLFDTTMIMANAADPSVTVDGMCTVSVSATKKLVTITAVQDYFSKSDSTINFDFSAARTALDNAGIEYDGYEVVLNASFKKANYPNLANIHFVDDFVTTVGNSMFSGMTNLQTVSFSDTITKLGNSVFSGCSNFAGSTSNNVVDLNNIVNIGNSAFSGCETLVGASFNNNTETIGSSTFQNCKKLNNIMLPATVKSIGANAFSGCVEMTDFTFAPNSVLSSIGNNCFSGCTSLEHITADGVSNSLPHSLSYASDRIFNGCTSLKSFTIPNTFLSVNQSMFTGCTSLAAVNFEQNSRCIAVDVSAFQGCEALTSIELPDTLISIGASAFMNCDTLQKVIVPDGLLSVGDSTFASCPVLSVSPRSKVNVANKVILPDGIKAVPKGCFQNDVGLTAVDLNKVETIGENAFQKCSSLTKIDIPQAVTVINKLTFDGCSVLANVNYSNQLTTIMDNAFSGCPNLSTFTPYGTTAYEGAAQFASTVGGVQQSAFLNCTSIKYLNFLKNSENTSNFAVVGKSAFEGCTSIRGSEYNGIASNTIQFPEGVVVVQPRAFFNCSSLDVVVFDGNVTTINDNAFQNCTSLTTVKMNPTITSLGANVFNGCTSLLNLPVTLDGKGSALTQLDVIRNYSFSNCTSLTKISIPANITSIGTYAFQKCAGLTEVRLSANAQLASIGNSAFDSCNKLSVFSTGTGTSSVFPASITSVGSKAFNLSALTNISFATPTNTSVVMSMGDSAFANNSMLQSVDLSKINLSITGANLFQKCTSMTSVKLPTSLSVISTGAFTDCNKLSTINSTTKGVYDIPGNVKTISATAFANNFCLATMKIPAKTDDITLSAWNCTLTYTQDDIDSGKYNPLKEFIVDGNNPNYKSVNGVLFNKAGTELYIYPHAKTETSYTVPSGVKSITSSAFSSNKSLVRITLNDNLESIAKNTFNKCTKLKNVAFGSNATVDIASGAFVGMTTANPIYFSAKANSTAQTYAEKTNGIDFVDNALEAENISLKQGSTYSAAIEKKTLQLEAVITTKNNTPATDILKWTTSDTTLATVNDSGLVTLKKAGDVTITVTTSTGKTAQVKLHIGSDFSEDTVKAELLNSSMVYTGSAVTPVPTVTLIKTGAALVKDTDYTLSYSNNVNKGTATITITGIGKYAGTITKQFTISDKLADNDVSGATVSNVTAQSCLGISIEPIVNVKIGTKLLLKGRDYSITYKNNVDIGTATFTITGKGKYVGSISKTFEIKARANSTVKTPRIIGRQTTPYAGVVSWVPDFTVNGTEVTYSYDNKFSNAKTLSVDGYGVNTAAINSLKGDKKNGYDNTKTLYVKARSYIIVNGQKTFGSWSDVRTIAPIK